MRRLSLVLVGAVAAGCGVSMSPVDGGTGGGSAAGGGAGGGGGGGGGSSTVDGGSTPDSGTELDAGFCPAGAPALSAADRAKSPRSNATAEILARDGSGTLVASDAIYARVERELADIRSASPGLQSVEARPAWDSLLVSFGAATSSVLDGGSPEFDCLNTRYGGTPTYLSFIRMVEVQFQAKLNLPLLAPAYRAVPGATNAETSNIGLISSDICLSIEGDDHAYVFYQGAGDCPSGCIEKDFTGILASADGGLTPLGRWSNHVPDAGPRPGWMTSRAAVCLPQGVRL